MSNAKNFDSVNNSGGNAHMGGDPGMGCLIGLFMIPLIPFFAALRALRNRH